MTHCTKGHEIKPEDIKASGGMILPCGCPAASVEGRRAEGLPDHGALPPLPQVTITLKGGPLNGARHELGTPPMPTLKACLWEGSIARWDGERYVRSYPTAVYKRSKDDRLVYVYACTTKPW